MSGISPALIRQRMASAITTALGASGWRESPWLGATVGMDPSEALHKSFAVMVAETNIVDTRRIRGLEGALRARTTVRVQWLWWLRQDNAVADGDSAIDSEAVLVAAVVGMTQTGTGPPCLERVRRTPMGDDTALLCEASWFVDHLYALDADLDDPGAGDPDPTASDWFVPLLADGTITLPVTGDAITQDADGWITGVVVRSANRTDPQGSGSGQQPRVAFPLRDATGAAVGWPYTDRTIVVELLLETSTTYTASVTPRAFLGLAEGNGLVGFSDSHRFLGWSVATNGTHSILHNYEATTTSDAVGVRPHVYGAAKAWSRRFDAVALDPATMAQVPGASGDNLTAQIDYQTSGSAYVQVTFGASFGSGNSGGIKVRPWVRVYSRAWPDLD